MTRKIKGEERKGNNLYLVFMYSTDVQQAKFKEKIILKGGKKLWTSWKNYQSSANKKDNFNATIVSELVRNCIDSLIIRSFDATDLEKIDKRVEQILAYQDQKKNSLFVA